VLCVTRNLQGGDKHGCTELQANCSRVHFHAMHLSILTAHRTGVGRLCTFATRQISGIPSAHRLRDIRRLHDVRCYCIFFLHFLSLEKKKKIQRVSIYFSKSVVILRNYNTFIRLQFHFSRFRARTMLYVIKEKIKYISKRELLEIKKSLIDTERSYFIISNSIR